MKKRLVIFVSLLLCIQCFMMPVFAAIDIPESTDRYINDYMNVLSQETIDTMNEKNDQLQNGAEIIVVTTDYINTDTEEFSYRLFNQWGIGNPDENNGVLITLVINEDKFWITTGTGLNDVLDAGTLSDIIYDYLEEDFDNGNYDRAVLNTFNEIHRILGNKYGLSYAEGTVDNSSDVMDFIIGLIVIFVIVMAIVLIVLALPSNGTRRVYRPTYRNHEPRRYNTYRGYGRDIRPLGAPRPVRKPTYTAPRTTTRSSFGSSTRSTLTRSFSGGMRSGGGGRTRGGGAGRK